MTNEDIKNLYCQSLDLTKDTFIPSRCIGCKITRNVIDCKKYIEKMQNEAIK